MILLLNFAKHVEAQDISLLDFLHDKGIQEDEEFNLAAFNIKIAPLVDANK